MCLQNARVMLISDKNLFHVKFLKSRLKMLRKYIDKHNISQNCKNHLNLRAGFKHKVGGLTQSGAPTPRIQMLENLRKMNVFSKLQTRSGCPF